MTFWEFFDKHPVLVFFLAIVLATFVDNYVVNWCRSRIKAAELSGRKDDE